MLKNDLPIGRRLAFFVSPVMARRKYLCSTILYTYSVTDKVNEVPRMFAWRSDSDRYYRFGRRDKTNRCILEVVLAGFTTKGQSDQIRSSLQFFFLYKNHRSTCFSWLSCFSYLLNRTVIRVTQSLCDWNPCRVCKYGYKAQRNTCEKIEGWIIKLHCEVRVNNENYYIVVCGQACHQNFIWSISNNRIRATGSKT